MRMRLASIRSITAATDPSGNAATNTRTVYVVDTTPPVHYAQRGRSADQRMSCGVCGPGRDGQRRMRRSLGVTTNSTVNPNAVGVYTINYAATDPSGNSATNTRTVYVVDTTAPVITHPLRRKP